MALLDSEIVAGAAHSPDLRERVVGAIEPGGRVVLWCGWFGSAPVPRSAGHSAPRTAVALQSDRGVDSRSRKIEADCLLLLMDAEPNPPLDLRLAVGGAIRQAQLLGEVIWRFCPAYGAAASVIAAYLNAGSRAR